MDGDTTKLSVKERMALFNKKSSDKNESSVHSSSIPKKLSSAAVKLDFSSSGSPIKSLIPPKPTAISEIAKKETQTENNIQKPIAHVPVSVPSSSPAPVQPPPTPPNPSTPATTTPPPDKDSTDKPMSIKERMALLSARKDSPSTPPVVIPSPSSGKHKLLHTQTLLNARKASLQETKTEGTGATSSSSTTSQSESSSSSSSSSVSKLSKQLAEKVTDTSASTPPTPSSSSVPLSVPLSHNNNENHSTPVQKHISSPSPPLPSPSCSTPSNPSTLSTPSPSTSSQSRGGRGVGRLAGGRGANINLAGLMGGPPPSLLKKVAEREREEREREREDGVVLVSSTRRDEEEEREREREEGVLSHTTLSRPTNMSKCKPITPSRTIFTVASTPLHTLDSPENIE
eukprot:CAMPEP_0182419026 /NCGR_PEP_ID=MMETSP1167-20130531/3407_1 /TAXON_ID=2988 /ORGANISM="Mallomonas Sp, Strain CCMP3275" /LENGTH=399 /DNA_ID=CAMNT_0024593589 /DNA_START=175 /DNA_END=1374 /DNA_ORIENTATION=+